MRVQLAEVGAVFPVQFQEDVDRKHRDEPDVSEINGTGGGEPRVLNRSLLTTAEERWESEDTDGNAGQSGAPPSCVPREHGLTDDVADEPCGHDKLRQVFAPSQITVREQHVPVREHEPCLRIRVGCTVERRWNQPGVKQQNREHRCKDDAVTQHLVRPKSVTCSSSLSLFLGLLKVFFFLHVHGGDSTKVVNQSHFLPSVSMRFRNTLYPYDEQVDDDQRGDDHR